MARGTTVSDEKDDLFAAAQMVMPVHETPELQALARDSDDKPHANIIEQIGEEKTALLCSRLGGVTVECIRVREQLVAIIGEEAAESLVSYFGSEKLYIPRRATTYLDRRRRALALRREGKTTAQIALSLGVCERQVFKYFQAKR